MRNRRTDLPDKSSVLSLPSGMLTDGIADLLDGLARLTEEAADLTDEMSALSAGLSDSPEQQAH
ncbi:MAG: hypothetical protein H8E57_10495 [Candidatus Cloacimonetes bacterium]|nr:hypothetical protein [Candidatus Cloacimonadota bacterium]